MGQVPREEIGIFHDRHLISMALTSLDISPKFPYPCPRHGPPVKSGNSFAKILWHGHFPEGNWQVPNATFHCGHARASKVWGHLLRRCSFPCYSRTWDPAEVPLMTELWDRSLQQVRPCKIPLLLQREGLISQPGKSDCPYVNQGGEGESLLCAAWAAVAQPPSSHSRDQVPLSNSSSGAEKSSPRSSSQVYPSGPVFHPQGTDQAKRCGEYPQGRANKLPSSHSETILIWMQSLGLPASPSFTHFSSLIQGIPRKSDSQGNGWDSRGTPKRIGLTTAASSALLLNWPLAGPSSLLGAGRG